MPIIYLCDDCGRKIEPQHLDTPKITPRIGGQIVRCRGCQRESETEDKIFPDLELPKIIVD